MKKSISFLFLTLISICIQLHANIIIPEGPVRTIAEWEPALGAIVMWPPQMPDNLIIELAKNDKLYVLLYENEGEYVKNQLKTLGINLDHVEFISCSQLIPSTRDTGPTQIFDGKNQWGIIDPFFIGWPLFSQQEDKFGKIIDHYETLLLEADTICTQIALNLNAPLYSLPIFLTGGNFVVDGHGTAFCTKAMLLENQIHTNEESFRAILSLYAGIDRLIVLDNIEDRGIQHIDCWFKLLNEETILVKQAPIDHPYYDRIEENVAKLQSLKTPYGNLYTIERIYCPEIPKRRPWDSHQELAAYTNALILNKKVLIPLFGILEDENALETWRRIMPGYQILGFEWEHWYHDDALHCATNTIFDKCMLYVSHQPFQDRIAHDENGYPVIVKINDYSHAGLDEEKCNLVYKAKWESSWNRIALQSTNHDKHYLANIPSYKPRTRIEYYIEIADHSGRETILPLTAPEELYQFQIKRDVNRYRYYFRHNLSYRNVYK